jgi:triacylglycerol lipase
MKRSILKSLAISAAILCTLPGLSHAQSTATQYPVVLVHGLFGFDSGMLTGDYFYGIAADLRRNGAKVLVPEVPAVNSNEVRGESLLKQLKQYQATYGYTKFNIIGHSQGAPTARYVAGVAPSMVASVTTVGGVNKGTPVADAALALGTGVWGGPLAKLITALAGNVSSTDLNAALRSLSNPGATAFNKKFPAAVPTTSCGSGAASVNGIKFYSVSGTGVLTNVLDISDVLVGGASVAFLGAQSDGLVGKCASHLGTVLKDNYNWNHLDEVNQVSGLRAIFSEDPVAFYRSQVNRLKNAGL